MTGEGRDAVEPRDPAPPARAAAPPPAALGAPAPASISSDALFAGGRELHITHHGALYRLKQTSSGKLILTK